MGRGLTQRTLHHERRTNVHAPPGKALAAAATIIRNVTLPPRLPCQRVYAAPRGMPLHVASPPPFATALV